MRRRAGCPAGPAPGVSTYCKDGRRARLRPGAGHGLMRGMPWDAAELAGAACDALAAEDARLRAEQSVYGVDALGETALHAVLARGLGLGLARGGAPGEVPGAELGNGHGWGVLREVRYPSLPAGAGRTPAERARERCDLVLTPGPGQVIADPVATRRVVEAGAGTLFGAVAQEMAARARPANAIEPEEAAWIEVKAIGQVAFRDGVPTPNTAYAAELTRGPLADAVKLAAEPRAGWRACLVVLFTADEAAARHDLAMLAHRLLDFGTPIGTPGVRVGAIEDRVGQGAVGVAVVPVRGAEGEETG